MQLAEDVRMTDSYLSRFVLNGFDSTQPAFNNAMYMTMQPNIIYITHTNTIVIYIHVQSYYSPYTVRINRYITF